MILYTVALSLAFLMILGVVLNAVGSLFALGLVSALPLLIGMSVSVLALSAIIYFRDRSQPKPVAVETEYRIPLSVLAICLFPLWSIVGTYFMNYYGANFVLLTMLFGLSFIPIVVTFNKIPVKFYPLLIFSVSLSLLYYNSLINSNLTGWDIHIEYYFANLVKTHSYWNPTLPLNYNAMLSVVMLGPIFSDIGGMSLASVFKMIYPFLFSFVPVGLYELFRKRTNKTIAFLSCFFFMGNYVFYTEMVQLARQEIASIFLVLLFLLIIDGKLQSLRGKFLFGLLGFGLIVSHYSLTYLFLFSIVVISVAMLFIESSSAQKIRDKIIKSQANKKPPTASFHRLFLPKTLVVVMGIVTFVWYFFVAGSSSLTALTGVLGKILRAGLSGLVNPSTSQGLSMIVSSGLPLHQVNKVLYLVFQGFILVGFLVLIFRSRFGNFSRAYIGFAFVSLIIAFACIGIPYFSNALNASRLYLVTLIFLAPLGIIGAIFLLQGLGKIFRTKIKAEAVMKVVGLLLALFLLFNSGFIYEATKNNPTAMALDNGIDYPRFSDGEVLAAKWIAHDISKGPTNVTVYGDEYGRLLLSELDFWQVKTFWGDTDQVANSSVVYIYLRAVNVKGEVMASWSNQTYINIQNSSFAQIVRNAVLVYEPPSEDAQVYRLASPNSSPAF